MDNREIRFDGWTVNFVSGEITRGGNTHRLQDQPLLCRRTVDGEVGSTEPQFRVISAATIVATTSGMRMPDGYARCEPPEAHGQEVALGRAAMMHIPRSMQRH